MTQIYYSWQDMVEEYNTQYHDGSDELKVAGIYQFLRDKCQDKISWVQAAQIQYSLQIPGNIKVLYERVNILLLTKQVAKFIEKKARKAKLHQ